MSLKSQCRIALIGLLLFAVSATAGEIKPIIITPDNIPWTSEATHPGSLIAKLFKDPNQPQFFVTRIKFSPGAEIKPHTHPVNEYSTVLSGTLYLGFGTEFDKNNTQELPAGSFVMIPANTPHFAWTEEGATMQLVGLGEWKINYIPQKNSHE
jgi:quercetin dioxygenase-like cupin family protein